MPLFNHHILKFVAESVMKNDPFNLCTTRLEQPEILRSSFSSNVLHRRMKSHIPAGASSQSSALHLLNDPSNMYWTCTAFHQREKHAHAFWVVRPFESDHKWFRLLRWLFAEFRFLSVKTIRHSEQPAPELHHRLMCPELFHIHGGRIEKKVWRPN